MSGSYFIFGTRSIGSCFGSLVALNQGHWDGCQKMFPHPLVNHVWFEEISFRDFPKKLKSVSRKAVAATVAAAETAAERDQQQQVPRLPGVT